MNSKLRSLLAIMALLASQTVFAHSGDATGFASIAIDGSTVIYRLTPTVAGTDDAKLVRLMREKITVTADGQACPPSEPKGMEVNYVCPTTPNHLMVRDDMADELGDKHHIIAVLTWSGGSSSLNFSATEREASVTLKGAEQPKGAASFFLLGVEHIATGYDHLLFLLAM